MAARPTFASVTDVRCKCRWLQDAADDPLQPIVFDKKTNEYQIRYREPDEINHSMLIIYHCPFCGGAAPMSKRASLFHAIPLEEKDRLLKLLAGITSLRGAIRKLGKPNYDNPRGTKVETPRRAGRAPTIQWYRTLCFDKLSKVADVWFTERADGQASWRLQGK